MTVSGPKSGLWRERRLPHRKREMSGLARPAQYLDFLDRVSEILLLVSWSEDIAGSERLKPSRTQSPNFC